MQVMRVVAQKNLYIHLITVCQMVLAYEQFLYNFCTLGAAPWAVVVDLTMLSQR